MGFENCGGKLWWKIVVENCGGKLGSRLSKEVLDNEVTCLVCNRKLKNPIALSRHLKFQNQLKSKEYYDKHSIGGFIYEFPGV